MFFLAATMYHIMVLELAYWRMVPQASRIWSLLWGLSSTFSRPSQHIIRPATCGEWSKYQCISWLCACPQPYFLCCKVSFLVWRRRYSVLWQWIRCSFCKALGSGTYWSPTWNVWWFLSKWMTVPCGGQKESCVATWPLDGQLVSKR